MLAGELARGRFRLPVLVLGSARGGPVQEPKNFFSRLMQLRRGVDPSRRESGCGIQRRSPRIALRTALIPRSALSGRRGPIANIITERPCPVRSARRRSNRIRSNRRGPATRIRVGRDRGATQ